jgi:hypothetical protein
MKLVSALALCVGFYLGTVERAKELSLSSCDRQRRRTPLFPTAALWRCGLQRKTLGLPGRFALQTEEGGSVFILTRRL